MRIRRQIFLKTNNKRNQDLKILSLCIIKSTGLKNNIKTSDIKCQKSKSESDSLGATERLAPTQKVKSDNKLIV